MDEEMMIAHHQELDRLHQALAYHHHKISCIQTQIANLNRQMAMHMMDNMEENNNH